MSTVYRQSITVELQGNTSEDLHVVRLKFERMMSQFGTELSKTKNSGGVIGVLPDKVREWNPDAVKKTAG